MYQKFRIILIVLLLASIGGCNSDVKEERDRLSKDLSILTFRLFQDINQDIREEKGHQSILRVRPEDSLHLNRLDTLTLFGLENDSVFKIRMRSLSKSMLIPDRSGNLREGDSVIFNSLKESITKMDFKNVSEVRYLFFYLCDSQFSTYNSRKGSYCGWGSPVVFQKGKKMYGGDEASFMVFDPFINYNTWDNKWVKIKLSIRRVSSNAPVKYEIANFHDFYLVSFVPSKKGTYLVYGSQTLFLDGKEIKSEEFNDVFLVH